MIYKIVCAGENHFAELYKKDNEEVIIAVDGGYKVLCENNIKTNYFFGDFDSLEETEIACDNVKKYSSIKDKSDFELAIDYLVQELKINKNDKVLVYNSTGGRLDHFYGILNVVVKYKEFHIEVIDKYNRIFISDLKMNLKKNEYKYISFYSINNDTIISLEGFKYNIKEYSLKNNDNLCLSNEITEVGHLDSNKKVLIIESK